MPLPAGLAQNAFLPTHLKNELTLTGTIRRGATGKNAKFVQERLTLAGYALKIDSDFGFATETQLKAFQQAKGLAQNGIYGNAEHDLLAKTFVSAVNPPASPPATFGPLVVKVGRQHTAQHPIEVGGANSGPWVRMYMDGLEGAQWLWCAGFVFFLIGQACALLGKPLPMAKTYSCDVVAERAKSAGKFLSETGASTPAGKAKIVPGSLFLVRASKFDWTHVGMVTKADADTFATLEGNTDSGGSANGFEAVERVRNYSKKDFVIW
jgi:peptidoglycan hydrolase-like protein with peptidoglycan-binding domain